MCDLISVEDTIFTEKQQSVTAHSETECPKPEFVPNFLFFPEELEEVCAFQRNDHQFFIKLLQTTPHKIITISVISLVLSAILTF